MSTDFMENQGRPTPLRWLTHNPGNFQLVLMRLSRGRSTMRAANQLSQFSIRISRNKVRKRIGIYMYIIATLQSSVIRAVLELRSKETNGIFFCRSLNIRVPSSRTNNHRLTTLFPKVIKKQASNDIVRNKSEHQQQRLITCLYNPFQSELAFPLLSNSSGSTVSRLCNCESSNS